MTTFPEGDVYVSKLKFGQRDSDSVRRLQDRLNDLAPKDSEILNVTGNYTAKTDAAVRAWQASIGDTPDAVKESFLGPLQANLIFKGTGNNVIDDSKDPVSAGTSLGNHLKSKGHKVVDSNVPFGRTSTWIKPNYIIVHHTATPDSWSEKQVADYVKFGGQYPPLSQIVLGKSGTVWMTTQQRKGQAEPGRASHAGAGSWPGVPTDRMNEQSIGIECQNDGKSPLKDSTAQYQALIALIVDLCERYDIPAKNVIGHKEWSSTGKIDPRDSMDKIRADVKIGLAGDPVTPEVPTEPSLPDPSPKKGLAKRWRRYSGKPDAPLIVDAGKWKAVDVSVPPAPFSGREDHMLYVRVEFKGADFDYWEGTGMAHVECKYVRDGGTPDDPSDDDGTAYDERHYENNTKSIPFQMVHWEEGERGVGGQWFVKIGGSVNAARLTTRYCKVDCLKVFG